MAKFRINILGCGSASPSLRHLPTSQVIDHRDRLMMVDCGEGAQLAMRKQRLKFSRLSHIFISHLHGDHCFGVPGLLSTLALHEKGSAVTIHTFADGADMLRRIMDYFCGDTPYDIHYNIIKPGQSDVIYEDDSLTVSTFPLYHRVPCNGYIFREKEKPRHIDGEMARFYQIPLWRLAEIKAGADYITPDGRTIPNARLTTDPEPAMSYAFCSDTMFDKRVARAVEGVDTIYHEATYDDAFASQARERGHSTAREAARIAAMAGARRLVLGHFSKRYLNESTMLEQAREEFPNVIIARDGLTIDLL